MLKLDRLETHDRYKSFTSQGSDISACCQDLINKRPFGNHAFYIWVHSRTDEDGSSKRLIWQPRLTRPLPQTNSMLFKAYPTNDTIKIIWILPPREMWSQYEKGKVCQNEMIGQFIYDFEHNRALMERNEPDDLTDEQINSIYKDLSIEAKRKKAMDRLYLSK